MVKLILVNVRNGMESITRNSIISRFKNYEHGRFSENHITYNVPGPGKALTRTNLSPPPVSSNNRGTYNTWRTHWLSYFLGLAYWVRLRKLVNILWVGVKICLLCKITLWPLGGCLKLMLQFSVEKVEGSLEFLETFHYEQ